MSARVLVVDDIPVNVRLLEAKLSAEYFDVITAGSGAEALGAIAASPPDIVLLDVMMPGRDGWEVCRMMKQHPILGRVVRIIMVTALGEWDDKRQALQTGADDYIEKPFDLPALAKAVERNAALLPKAG